MNKLVSLLSVGLLAAPAMAQACFDSNYGLSLGSTNDTVYPAESIGFSFPFDGATYTDIHISDHGVCWLSNGGVPAPAVAGATTYNILLTDFNAFGPCIAPFWADANCGYAPNTLGEVFINNTDPSRCVITWSGIWTYFNIGPQYDFQLVLKANGEVEFVYSADVSNYGSTFAPNAIVGMTPGGGAVLPAASDLSTGPVTTDPSIFEEFINPLDFDMPADGLRFIPTSPGWVVVGLGGPTGCADISTYGDGCVREDGMFFEDHAAGAFDLAGVTMTMFRNVDNYLVLDSIPTAYVAPGPNALVIADGDELEETVALSSPMPIPGGSTGSVTVESNGRITLDVAGSGPDFTPSGAELQAAVVPTIAPHWHDMNPAAAGSGKITFEEVGGVAYITYDNVFDYNQTAGPGSTFQVQMTVATGDITVVWVSSSLTGNNVVTGFTAGAATNLPNPKDLSVDLTATFTAFDAEIVPLALDGNAPKIAGVWDLTTTNIDAVSPVAITFFGPQAQAPLPLSVIGFQAPGCDLLLGSVSGALQAVASGGSATLSLQIPTNPNLSGQSIAAQSLCLTLLNPGNVLVSNGVVGTVGL